MSDNPYVYDESYSGLSFVALLTKAIATRDDTAPLLEEARRRDEAAAGAHWARLNTPMPDGRMGKPTGALDELAAAGRRLGPEWQIIGAPFLTAGEAEFGVCVRMRKAEVAE